MDNTFMIGGRGIGKQYEPFIIAEMSGNHNQSLEQALRIVDAAAYAGVQALKLQTYTADSITLDSDQKDFIIDNSLSLWNGRRMYELYSEASTPWEWHQAILERCKQHNMLAFSSPFDEEAVDFLESLDVPCYKVASYENNHLPLIRKIAQTGKPVIISTGMSTLTELAEAVETYRGAGGTQLALLKCTSNYPASPENSNILTIPHLRELFKCEIGLSDHTLGIGVPVAAVALGATIVEKHLTISRAEGGVDAAFSLEPEEMKNLVVESKRAWQAIGHIQYGPNESEMKSRNYRRSIYAAQDIDMGETITSKHIKVVRPAFGLQPKHFDSLLGKTAKSKILKGTAISWEHI